MGRCAYLEQRRAAVSLRHLPPRMRQIPVRKSAVLSVLDIGASKVVCLIARLSPMEQLSALPGRTHRCKVLGIGHQRSSGVKGGAIVDLQAAEQAVRLAIDAAERMAGVEVGGVILNMSGGLLASRRFNAKATLHGKTVSEHDIHRVLEAASAANGQHGRTVLHALPTGYSLDATRDIHDPKGMIGEELGVDLHVASCESAALRNLTLVVERCHLRVEAMVATPYATGLSTMVDDEAELGAAVIDFGGGTTTVGVFSGGRLLHVDAVAVGGIHVTRDIARGLNVSMSDAERLKTLYGACLASPSDDRESITLNRLGDDMDHPTHLPKSELLRIIRPRVEEILELVRDRLKASGHAALAGRRLVMTGGACQLTGLPELARTIISNQARVGRPLGIEGLPESGKSPSFAAAVGLMVYPQMAGLEYFEPSRHVSRRAPEEGGYAARVGRWLKESF
jgi:cell division protein FtsA